MLSNAPEERPISRPKRNPATRPKGERDTDSTVINQFFVSFFITSSSLFEYVAFVRAKNPFDDDDDSNTTPLLSL